MKGTLHISALVATTLHYCPLGFAAATFCVLCFLFEEFASDPCNIFSRKALQVQSEMQAGPQMHVPGLFEIVMTPAHVWNGIIDGVASQKGHPNCLSFEVHPKELAQK